MNNLRKVLDEASIEIVEVNEELHWVRLLSVDQSTTACIFRDFIFNSSIDIKSSRKIVFWTWNCQNSDLWKSELFREKRTDTRTILQCYHWFLRRESESMRISIVDSQSFWTYQEFKSHTTLDVSSIIRIQVTYNLWKILHELHIISLVSLMMLELSLLSI